MGEEWYGGSLHTCELILREFYKHPPIIVKQKRLEGYEYDILDEKNRWRFVVAEIGPI